MTLAYKGLKHAWRDPILLRLKYKNKSNLEYFHIHEQHEVANRVGSTTSPNFQMRKPKLNNNNANMHWMFFVHTGHRTPNLS